MVASTKVTRGRHPAWFNNLTLQPAHVDQSFQLVTVYEPCAQSTYGVGVLDSGTEKGGVNSIGQCFHT